jgi:hypothetical protein
MSGGSGTTAGAPTLPPSRRRQKRLTRRGAGVVDWGPAVNGTLTLRQAQKAELASKRKYG